MTRPLVPNHIEQLKPYIPGKPTEELERELGISGSLKLASNENSLGPSPKALVAMAQTLPELYLYPEATCHALVKRLSEKLSVDPTQLVFGNGSDEIITLILQTFCEPGDRVSTSAKTFLMYKVFSRAMNIECVEAPLGADYQYDLDAIAEVTAAQDARVVFLANPSNPTGCYFGAQELSRFLGKLDDDVIVVLDEAYREYVTATDFPDSLQVVRERPRTIVLRTFSKAFGLAGIRVGYGVMSSELAVSPARGESQAEPERTRSTPRPGSLRLSQNGYEFFCV